MLHKMKLDPAPFQKIRSGEKTIELRLYDEKRRLIKPGDMIEFTNTGDESILRVRAKNIYVFSSFEELYRSLPPEKCGYGKDEAKKADPKDMLKFYSKEMQDKYGVIGIETEPCRK